MIPPVLANIYLHYVQDLWIRNVVSKHCKGRVLFRRYADDSVECFEREEDAQAYLRAPPKRLEKFGLQLAEEKSSLVRFDRRNPEASGRFTFLGFDFHWAGSWRYPDYVPVRRRTNRKKFRASLLALKEWLKRSRHLKMRDLLVVLRRKLQGYWNYYGVIGNSMMTLSYSRGGLQPAIQVAEPSQPEPFHDLGQFRKTQAWLGDPRTRRDREAPMKHCTAHPNLHDRSQPNQ